MPDEVNKFTAISCGHPAPGVVYPQQLQDWRDDDFDLWLEAKLGPNAISDWPETWEKYFAEFLADKINEVSCQTTK